MTLQLPASPIQHPGQSLCVQKDWQPNGKQSLPFVVTGKAADTLMWLRLVDQSVAFSYSENLNLGTHLLKHVKWSLLGAPTPQLPLLTVVLWRLNTTYQGAAGSA